jgi:hypothetical protein
MVVAIILNVGILHRPSNKTQEPIFYPRAQNGIVLCYIGLLLGSNNITKLR